MLSVHPLYAEGQTVLDDGLVGVWQDADAPDDETWQFIDDGAGGYRLIIRENDSLQIRPGEDGIFTARLVDLGGRRFMDLFPEEPAGRQRHLQEPHRAGPLVLEHRAPGRSPRPGRVVGRRRSTAGPDDGLVVDRVERDDVSVLTEPTGALQRLFAAHADALFPETETLRRLQ